MIPTSFDESNHVLGRPADMSADECAPLSVHISPGLVISCWKLTKEELEEINKTGRVWLLVVGMTMPPVMLQVQSPFVKL